MRVVCVVAARPNFMKMAPVLAALDGRGAETVLVHTGQHYDPAMSDVFFDELGIRAPDHHLGIGSGTHGEQTARVIMAFEPVLEELAPAAVVVAGDVNSTMACALVAAKAGPLVAHVEAGLRSRDWAMPEEVNRVVTDRISDLLLAPSPDAVANLRDEGYRDDQIHLVGNVMVDSLLRNIDRARERDAPARFGLAPKRYGLVTLHRPSNVDDPATLGEILDGLGRVAKRIPLLYPAHPRSRKRVEAIGVPDGVSVVDPVGYLDAIALQDAAAVVLTDSGGVQEETTVLGVPCLTIRHNTERPITIEQGTNRLVGTSGDGIARAADEVLDRGVEPHRPALWDGHAADRIADVVLAAGASAHRRPTQR